MKEDRALRRWARGRYDRASDAGDPEYLWAEMGPGNSAWLLLPKYFFVALILGGLWAIIVIALSGAFAGGDPAVIYPVQWRAIAAILHFQVIPGSIGAVLCGLGLLLQHPKAFLRMRWMILKVLAVVIVVPLSHWYLSQSVQGMQGANLKASLLVPGVFLSLLGFVGIAILGRLKPRLGQKYTSAPPSPV